ncbi:MAG TPA: hypothetical protein VI731_10350 [Bacteroidia bacterium]|nr:hypothetical protein [Bacteroidia bacterium]
MDTGDLSQEAYKAIMIEAERFHHSLTLQFGVRAMDYREEEDFLKMAEKLIKNLKKLPLPLWEDVLFDPVGNLQLKDFHKTLEKISENIKEVRKIPVKKRTYDFS